MANNRMYLYHPATNQAFFIARSQSESWYVGSVATLLCSHLSAHLTDFLCDTANPIDKDNYMYGDRSFRILYETEPLPNGIKFYHQDSPCKECIKLSEKKDNNEI